MRHTASHNVPTPAATSRERPTLRTKRLVLRTLSAADAAALFPAYADPDTMRWWSCPPVTDVSALAARLEREDALLAWTICLDGTAIGRVSLRPH
ncbi:MAG: GNAT family N-acetyltransferase, partial [Sphingomonas sp.]